MARAQTLELEYSSVLEDALAAIDRRRQAREVSAALDSLRPHWDGVLDQIHLLAQSDAERVRLKSNLLADALLTAANDPGTVPLLHNRLANLALSLGWEAN